MPPLPTPERLRLLETLLLVRRLGEALVDRAAPAAAGCRGAAGCEAGAVGVGAALDARDRLLTGHRGAAALLARGADPGRLAAEVLGRATGYCGGRSGPLHVSVRELGVVLTSAIAGGGLAMAPGVALAQAMGAEGCVPGGVTVVFCGDAAEGAGLLHAAVQLAAAWRLPLLFVCEHGSGLEPGLRGETVPTATVDGHDVEAVRAQAQAFVEAIRSDGLPRLLGLAMGQPRDAVDQSLRRLRRERLLDHAAWCEMQRRVAQRVREAIDHAQAQAWPTATALTDLAWAPARPWREEVGSADVASTPNVETTASCLTMTDAVERALAAAMRRDPRVLVFGAGGATQRGALRNEFGAARVRDMPRAEALAAGAAVGAAAMGLRPVVDLLFAPFMTLAMDAFVNHAGKLRHLSGGQFEFPLVALAKTGAGACLGAHHQHNLEAVFAHVPGLKVVMPSTPADAAALLHAAIADPNPVLLFLDLALLNQPGDVPADVLDGRTRWPLARAALRRRGGDATLVGYGKTVATCLTAAEQLAAEGIQAEVLDLVTIKPLDAEAVIASVRRTGRLVVVHEAAAMCGIGAELAALVAERAFDALRAPVRRLTGPDAPTSASWFLEQAALPRAGQVAQAVREAMARP